MPNWDDHFKNHEIHLHIEELGNILSDLTVKCEDEGNLSYLSRISDVVHYIEAMFKALDPNLMPMAVLDEMTQNMINIKAHLEQFSNTSEQGQLANANNHADNAIIKLQQFPTITAPPEISSLSETVAAFRNTVKGYIERLTDRKNQLEIELGELIKGVNKSNEDIKTLNQTIENQKSRLDNAIAEFQGQFSNAEEERRKRFDENSQNREEAFRSFREKITSEMDEISEGHQERVNKEIDELKGNAQALLTAHENNAKGTIDFLNKKLEEAKQLVQVIGNVGVTGKFKEIADQERRKADWLLIAALGLMFLVVISSGFIVWSTGKDDIVWELIAFRMTATLAFLIPAIYAARESERHRRRERYNRKMELELASIDPYLELLDDAKRKEIKAKLTERFFGQPDQAGSDVDSIKSNPLMDIIKNAMNNLTKR